MLRKTYLRKIGILLCIIVAFYLFSLESFAHDDNPSGNVVGEFPTALEVEGNDYKMINNYGVISVAKGPGELLYNFGTISSLEGAEVQENCTNATIVKALNGTVTVNNGTIGYINGTAKIRTNAKAGVIEKNINTIEQNMGTVEENYGTICENRGNIDKVGEIGVVSKHIEGTIGENLGTVTVVPDSKGIITEAVIETNSGTVCVEADSDNKSTVKIVNNTDKLVIKEGADCIVENNFGVIEIEDGGKCILTGTNTGTMPQTGVVYPEGEYYRLILDNIAFADIQMLSNYKIVDDSIYVLKDKEFSFAIEKMNYSVMWSDDDQNYSASVEFIRSLEDDSIKYVDDKAKTVKLHIHTLDRYTPSAIKAGYHEILCDSCGELAKLEACSGGTATCKELAKCTKCGQQYGSLDNAHSFGEWIVTKDAEIGVEGLKYRKCGVCGFIENGTIPAKSNAKEPKGGENIPSNSSNGNSGVENTSDIKSDNSNSGRENEQDSNNDNNGLKDKDDAKRNKSIVGKTENDDSTGLHETVPTVIANEGQDKTQSAVQNNSYSREELPVEKEDETNIRSDEEFTDDTHSLVEDDSNEKTVKGIIVAVGACFAVAISSVAVVKIRKRCKNLR